MTHQNHQTNGASLEDCHTNFFALTDLCGIKWRKFLFGERPSASGEPLDDPILQSYTQCLSKDILCVWRRVAAPKQDPDPNATNPFDNIVTTHTHPPLALTAAKELWIFWYGDEPNFQDLVDPRLMEMSDANAQGAWESGLSYECRSLLFKALHNLIERCLLSRDIVRLGKWFVQPCSTKDQILGKSSHHLSFSFAFFVHGESTVCASMDLREHPAVRPLSPEYLAEAAMASAQSNGDARQKPVILAPFGLAATLTGNSFKSTDPTTEKMLRDWCCFYPLCNKENSELPQMVEVITDGVKMRYPSKYVLVTDLDDPKCSESDEILALHSQQQQQPQQQQQQQQQHQQRQQQLSPNNSTPNNLTHQQKQQLSLPYTHLPPSAATLLPERVWQDCITSSLAASANCNSSNSSQTPVSTNNNNSSSNSNSNCNNSNNNNNNNVWIYTDPTQKTSCSCTKTSGMGTPQGGGASTYSRNPHSIGESMQVPSVGSPSSAGPSPHPNSAHSQPTSIPPADQLLAASPRGPTSVPNTQPMTPIDHLEKNTPAPTPTDQHDSKSVTASPYVQQNPSIEPPPSAEGMTGPDSVGPVKRVEPITTGSSGDSQSHNITNSNNNHNGAVTMNNFMALMKRPHLATTDSDNADEDAIMQDLLYDFSSLDAWMDHPIKRFKPNENSKKQHRKMKLKDMYEKHKHQAPLYSPSSLVCGFVTTNSNDGFMRNHHNSDMYVPMNMDDGGYLPAHEIKKEIDDVKERKSLFTNEGLQVREGDLDQIFDDDNSSDETLQVQTPPGSNKSSGCGMDDNKKSFGTNNSNIHIRPEDLSHMFPTPPSHEHHPNSSPISGGITDNPMTDIKQEIYPDMGSPADEPIKDWSYVFIPPTIYTFVGSSKYAPLTNLPSQSMPPISAPQNLTYKPAPRQPPQQRQQQQMPSQQQQHHQQQQQDQTLQQQLQQMQQPHHPPHHNLPHGIINNLMPGATPNNIGLGFGNQLPRPPSAPLMGYSGPQAMLQQQLVGRAAMSPISPAAGGPQMTGFPAVSPMNHPINSFRRTPVPPPPPPYELAVSSPDTSTSSYLNKQFNSQEPPTPSSAMNRSPEANSLVVNVLLYDTELNVFRDHNFDSCTLCVCNADGQKYVGNIRGSDSGLYVSLPGTSFNPALSNGIVSTNMCQTNMMGGGGGGGGNSMRSLSAFGGIDSPSGGPVGGATGNQHQTGYVDEDPITCRCGFSAVVNRRLAYRSGLFYEDEMEITGMAEDPSFHKKKSILSVLLHAGCISNDDGTNETAVTQILMDLLRDQCTIIQSSSSSIQRTLTRYKRRTATVEMIRKLNILEFTDANDVICLAMEQGRIAFETSMNMTNRMEVEPYRSPKANISVHRWPFVMAEGTRSNQDIIRMMKSTRPLLQNAFHSKNRKRWEATYDVKGPLTWRQFHMLAGRGMGQCEPQPIPSLIVGHEKDWLSVSPYAIHYWDKLMLEPFSYPRDVVYLVVCPEEDLVVSRSRTFFKELSTTYEMCKLGRHTPIKGWDGILQVGGRLNRETNDHSMSPEQNCQTSGTTENKLAEQLKLYVNAFQTQLVPYLSRIPNDKSLLDPPKDLNSNLSKDRPMPSPMPPPNTPDSSQSSDKAPNTPKCDNEAESQRDNVHTTAGSNSPLIDSFSSSLDDDINPPIIVIYVIDPFTLGSDSNDLQRAACLSLLKCYHELLNSVPESIRSTINLQIISLESILELGRNRTRLRFSDEMKALALNVFSQCRRYMAHTAKVRSLTGFGTAANMELFLKRKDEKNRSTYKMYTPPYILAPIREKTDKSDTFRLKNSDQQYSVMYCNYCLSEDQSWLLASATDERGELMETIAINIDIPNIRRRRHAPARRQGLKKLMDFILGLISQTVQPWRLVIGRIGRIGHGELKSWSWLLSKQNLQKVSKELKDVCKQCSIMSPHQVPSILSACLVTVEPDSNFRVMPDQFTPDERFSQISMQNPLSTPQDVTCTHILVFPTSAVSQSYQRTFNETHINGLENDDDIIFDFGGEEDDQIGDVNSMGDIFDWDQVPMQQIQERNSNQGSPGSMEDNRSRQSAGNGGNNFNSMRSMYDTHDMEEVGQVLQQPLALGYLVSTAPTGPMPAWFWSSCPHMENICPVFLKTALHLHVAAIQQASDDPLIQNQSSATDHPLDSQLTADVLRYVLEGYNVLSWLAMDSNTHDRLSCLPINVQVLMQLYHMAASMA